MAEVRLPTALLTLFPGTPRRLVLPGATVREVLASLDSQVPGIHDRLFTTGSEIREHIRVFVDGEAAELGTPVSPRSALDVVLAVSGG
jgi:molybdopterin synthase sulfur carrier subunit